MSELAESTSMLTAGLDYLKTKKTFDALRSIQKPILIFSPKNNAPHAKLVDAVVQRFKLEKVPFITIEAIDDELPASPEVWKYKAPEVIKQMVQGILIVSSSHMDQQPIEHIRSQMLRGIAIAAEETLHDDARPYLINVSIDGAAATSIVSEFKQVDLSTQQGPQDFAAALSGIASRS